MRHNLPQITVIGFDAKMTEAAGYTPDSTDMSAERRFWRSESRRYLVEEVHHHAVSVTGAIQ